jgi:uncharacterized protein (TIGR03083 family)
VEHDDYVDAAARETDALGAALAAGPLSAPVPTCPGWTLTELARHVGEFSGFWTHVLCEGMGQTKTPFSPAPEDDDDDARREWVADLFELLLRQLRATPPETAVWTWYEPDQSAAFVARRVSNELAIHRYDAQSARSTCEPIDRLLAIDGIDEMVTRLVQIRGSDQADGQTIHLHGTDGDDPPAEWLLTLHPDRVEATRTHAKGDLALRGSVSDLELLLYGRPTLGQVERLGDESVLDIWYQVFTF